uniref:Uncharacterized protein n=1 Tax=Heterorhabditis bacteriophora TaxID=37862 RepID=A0A1I7XJV5_HETBA
MRGNFFTSYLKHFALFNQLSSLTNIYFGWPFLNTYPSDEFDKKKEKEMETPPGHGEEPILP